MWIISIMKELIERFSVWFGIANKKVNVLFTGLDNSGKTALLSRLKYSVFNGDEYLNSKKENVFSFGRVTFTAEDVYQGVNSFSETAWNRTFEKTDAIIFLIDVSDKSRYEEARELLNTLLGNAALSGVPFLILGNKCEKVTDLDDDSFRSELFTKFSSKENKPGGRYIYCTLCSVKNKIGFPNGIQWLSNYQMITSHKTGK